MLSRAKSKALRFLPLAFLAGTHGFALFAPYVAVVLAALHLRTRHRQRGRDRAGRERAGRPAEVVPGSASVQHPDLEPAPA